MQSIPTLFVRDERGRAMNQIAPGCEWVIAHEGRATVKIDGTACMVRAGRLYKRMKASEPVPVGWESCHVPPMPSGHGWYPVGNGPEDRWHREASLDGLAGLADGTYELVGPNVQRNPYRLTEHCLLRHGDIPFLWPMIDMGENAFDIVRRALSGVRCEGIVWHHPDGRMVKLKRRDFGIPWPDGAAPLKVNP